MGEPSELNLWTRQWRDELIRKARADWRERDAAYWCLKDKSTDYAKSIKMELDVSAQVLAVWEASPVDLPSDEATPSVPVQPDAAPSPGCRRCGGTMLPGRALAQTVHCADEGTCSPAGPGVLIDCLKCIKCGWSVTAAGRKDAP